MLGLHFMSMYDESVMKQMIRDMNPRVVKFFALPPSLVISVMSEFPDVDVIYRPWWDYKNEYGRYYLSSPDDFKTFRNYMGSRGKGPGQILTPVEEDKDMLEYFNPREAVLEMVTSQSSVVAHNMSHFVNAPESFKKRFLWEAFNETGGIGGGSRDYYRFERERAKWSRENGFRAAVISSGVGWTLDFGAMQDVGLLDEMQAHNHYLATHGYGCGFVNISHGEFQPVNTAGDLAKPMKYYWDNRKVLPKTELNTWLAFRVARYHNELKLRGYNIKQVLTEFAPSDASANHIILRVWHKPLRGWKTMLDFLQAQLGNNVDPVQNVVEQFVYSEQQLREYSDFLVGATIFTNGADQNSEWFSEFDVNSIHPRIATALKGLPDTPTEEPEEPPVQTGCNVELAETTPTGGRLTALNIRNKPYIINNPTNVIGQITRGQIVKALAKTYVNGTWWIKVELEDKTGWGSSAYLKLVCVNSELPEVNPPSPDEIPDDNVTELRKRITELETQNAQLLTQKAAVEAENTLLETRVATLEVSIDEAILILDDALDDEGGIVG